MASNKNENEFLFVQARTNPLSSIHEAGIFMSYAKQSGAVITIFNPFIDYGTHVPINRPGQVFDRFQGGVILGGSSDLFASRPDGNTDRFLETLEPLGSKLIDGGENSLVICWGLHAVLLYSGISVEALDAQRESGTAQMFFNEQGQEHYLFRGLPNPTHVIAIHEDSATALPNGAVLLGSTKREGDTHNVIAAIQIGALTGTQWHPELNPARYLKRRALNANRENGNNDFQPNLPLVPTPHADIPLRRFLRRATVFNAPEPTGRAPR